MGQYTGSTFLLSGYQIFFVIMYSIITTSISPDIGNNFSSSLLMANIKRQTAAQNTICIKIQDPSSRAGTQLGFWGC